ncbi:MAG TPA: response regulator [Verrucomicrobiae bacterium]|nr:response regulator [Verrucomicrobiae bacterium]
MTAPLILLAEDDTNDVYFFQRAVKKLAIPNPVHIARDGKEAVAYLNGEGEFADREKYPLPGLIVLDLNMPRQNGFEILKWLRQTPPLDQLPAVILTSSQAQRDIQQALELGAKQYYVKPSTPSKLPELLKVMMTYCR